MKREVILLMILLYLVGEQRNPVTNVTLLKESRSPLADLLKLQ